VITHNAQHTLALGTNAFSSCVKCLQWHACWVMKGLKNRVPDHWTSYHETSSLRSSGVDSSSILAAARRSRRPRRRERDAGGIKWVGIIGMLLPIRLGVLGSSVSSPAKSRSKPRPKTNLASSGMENRERVPTYLPSWLGPGSVTCKAPADNKFGTF